MISDFKDVKFGCSRVQIVWYGSEEFGQAISIPGFPS